MKKTTPLEKNIEKAIGTYAKSKGCLYYKFTSPAQRAVPDRIIVTPTGTVGFLEVKRYGAKPTPLQMAEMERLAHHNAHVAWVDNAQNGKELIDKLLKLPQ